MDTRYLRSVLLYILTAALSLLLIYYVCYHLFGGFESPVDTVSALTVTQKEAISADGYVFRAEQLLYAQSPGDVNYLFADGDKVGSNVKIADVLSGNSTIRNQVIAIDKQILLFQNSNLASHFQVSDTTAIDRQITSLYYLIQNSLAKGDTEYVLRKKDELLVLMNKRRVITHTVDDYSEQIKALQEQKEDLMGAASDITETVNSPVSGFFYSTVDGYENLFTIAALNRLTLDNFEQLTELSPEATAGATGQGYTIGKIVTDYNWYMVVKIPASQLRYFVLNQTYSVLFPYNGDTQIQMKLENMITSIDADSVILMFKTGIQPEHFNYLRMQTIHLVQATYTGYRVPVSAVRVVDGQKGVYVLDGSYVRFRKITTLYETDGYLIVEERDTQKDDAASYLGAGEKIITKGKNLYDGKIITRN